MFRRRALALTVATALVVGISYLGRGDASDQPRNPPSASTGRIDAQELDRMIDVFATRAPERGESVEYRYLGGLFLQRAAARASVVDYRSAADAFAASLDLAPRHPDALHGHSRASLGIHDFLAADASAVALLELDANDPDSLALAGDTAFALGDLDRSRDAFSRLAAATPGDPAVLVRLAQLELANGSVADARRLAAGAVDLAVDRDLAPGDLAFYESFAAHLLFTTGAYDDARAFAESAVANSPEDHGALGELARLRAAAGDIDAAVELLERANAIVPEPDHVVLLGDLLTALGDDDAASDAYTWAIELATHDQDHERAWARALASLLLDHPVVADHELVVARGGRIPWALEIAHAEAAVRNDLGASDLVAWAEYRAGNVSAARAAIDIALQGSPSEATVWYHAAVISAAEGDEERARREVSRALQLSPAFHPLLADAARVLLAELSRA